jgi:hypothetical protein
MTDASVRAFDGLPEVICLVVMMEVKHPCRCDVSLWPGAAGTSAKGWSWAVHVFFPMFKPWHRASGYSVVNFTKLRHFFHLSHMAAA